MRIHHKGVVVEMDDADTRVKIVELLIFGGPFAVLTGVPADPPAAATPPQPVPPPPPPVPEHLLRFWHGLRVHEQQELVLLSERPYRATELEALLGITEGDTRGSHSRLSRLARSCGVKVKIGRRGNSHANRRYDLDHESMALVKGLLDAGVAKPFARAPAAGTPP